MNSCCPSTCTGNHVFVGCFSIEKSRWEEEFHFNSTCSYSTWRCWISLGICWFGVIIPDRFEYQNTDSRLTGIEAMAPERIDQFSHRRYVSLSLLSFHLSCIEAVWGFLISWPFSWWVLYPLLPVAWWLLSTITEHQSWIELWYWSVGFMKCFPGVNLVLYILDL